MKQFFTNRFVWVLNFLLKVTSSLNERLLRTRDKFVLEPVKDHWEKLAFTNVENFKTVKVITGSDGVLEISECDNQQFNEPISTTGWKYPSTTRKINEKGELVDVEVSPVGMSSWPEVKRRVSREAK